MISKSIKILALIMLHYYSVSQSISGFTQWKTGHDSKTIAYFPIDSKSCLINENGKWIAHAKFKVEQYGEMSFPINPSTPSSEEALKVDLSKSQFIIVRYKSNQPLILQLREYNIHGGVQNHIILRPSDSFTTKKVLLSSFKGGKTPLDLKNVAKFNFAVLSNNQQDGFAEFFIDKFLIDNYTP